MNKPEPIQLVLSRVTRQILSQADFIRSEHDAQVAVIQWAKLAATVIPELNLLFAIPNGAKLPYVKKNGHRYSPQAIFLKDEGLRPGIPDLCLPVPRQGFHGLFIELKHGKNKPTEQQAAILDALAEQGYCTGVCWGPADVIETICDYLGVANA